MSALRTLPVAALVAATLAAAVGLILLGSAAEERSTPHGATRRAGAAPPEASPRPPEEPLSSRRASPAQEPPQRAGERSSPRGDEPGRSPRPATEVEVLVLDPRGAPVAEAEVRYDGGLVCGVGRTDPRGLLELRWEEGHGTYALAVEATGALPGGVGVGRGRLRAQGGTRGARLVVELEPAVEVTLVFDCPLEKGRALSELPWGGRGPEAGWSEPRTRQALPPVTAPGRYRVRVEGLDPRGEERLAEGEFEVDAQGRGPRALRLTTAALATLTLQVESTLGDASAVVWVEEVDLPGGALGERRSLERAYRLHAAGRPGDEGWGGPAPLPQGSSLSLKLSPGTYDVSTRGSSDVTLQAQERVTLAAGARRELTLRLSSSHLARVELGELASQTVAVEGPPLAWAAQEGDTLVLGGLGLHGARVLVASRGRERVGLVELAPGQLRARIEPVAPGALTADAPLRWGDAELQLERRGAPRYPWRLMIAGADLRPLSSVERGETRPARLQPALGLSSSGPPFVVRASARARAGSYRVEGLQPGSYRVFVAPDEGPPAVLAESLTVEPGRVARLRVPE